MSNLNRKRALVPKMYCRFFGHQYQVSKQVTEFVYEYKCCKCKKEVTTNAKGGLTELTKQSKEINAVLEHIHYRRQLKTRGAPIAE
ncbi:hypothetical protein [Bizionia paragorgiae]|uniref:hypothetical protein n=1 Tax=Bizionia paragorgiae TaxID=283786 RepID=UPI00299F436A|nr:hypothetical protein [Bizionia paragorgiae]MDX1272143.1 hypothetical protein [Bizionia paragorgiae]